MTQPHNHPSDAQLTDDKAGLAQDAAPAGDADVVLDDNPENVPTNAWVTMGLFAAFVIAFGTCASTFMFN